MYSKKDTVYYDDAWENFGNAIVLLAVKDYRTALSSLRRSPSNYTANMTKQEVERFFRSGLFSAITTIDPERLIAQLNKEVATK